MNSLVKNVLLCFIDTSLKVEMFFGLSDFTFNGKRLKLLFLLSSAIRILLLVLYPISFLNILNVYLTEETSGITRTARYLTFIFNWLLLLCMFSNETFSNRQRMNSTKRLLSQLIEHQSAKQNCLLLLKFLLKFLVVSVSLIRTSIGNYSYSMKSRLTTVDFLMVPFIVLPFLLLTLASNRIYVANVVVQLSLTRNIQQMKSSRSENAIQIQVSAINYRCLHKFFSDFNSSNSINLLVVLTFCTLNIINEVNHLLQLCNLRTILEHVFVFSDLLFVLLCFKLFQRPSTNILRSCWCQHQIYSDLLDRTFLHHQSFWRY